MGETLGDSSAASRSVRQIPCGRREVFIHRRPGRFGVTCHDCRQNRPVAGQRDIYA